LAGTGKEEKGGTVLLATRDWKYLALLSKRAGGDDAKLFLINTADGSLTTMDEGAASFTLAGWEGHRFLYTVNRYKLADWEPKKQALKSFNADDKKLTTLDQTTAEGSSVYDYKREIIDRVYIVEGRVLYIKHWQANWYSALSGKQVTLSSLKPDGSSKQVVKTFESPDYVEVIPYEPSSLYLKSGDKIYEYEFGAVKGLPDMKPETFYNTDYATYLISPDGKRAFWTQNRDGKQVFFVGDNDGKNETKVATLDTDCQVYGWYTDDYLLVSKKGSELLIMPVTGVDKVEQLFKITDYYKPYYSYFGYGGGYGGI
jgi:hypothetical protein